MLDYIFLLSLLIKYIKHDLSSANVTDALVETGHDFLFAPNNAVLCDDGYQQFISRSIGGVTSKSARADIITRLDMSITSLSVPN
jgi:hypothetical protein